MKRNTRKANCIWQMLLALLLTITLVVPVSAKKTGVEEAYLQTDAKAPSLHSEAAVLMDAKTGEVLYQKNGKKKEYPASITKCMTSLVAIENNDLSDMITYSENAVFNIEEGSSSAAIDVGEQITVEQSLYAAMLESANEACNALAETTGGSIPGFVDMMNQKAESLGCVKTHFNNANGLYDKKHYTCAYDMALIVRDAMKNDTWRKISGTKVYEVPPTNKQEEVRYWRNHHNYVNGDVPYDNTFYTVEGGKTGYTEVCKYTLVTYAKSNTSDMELICVTMRCEDYGNYLGKSYSHAYTDAANLLNYGFSNFQTISSQVDFETMNQDQELTYVQSAYEMLNPEKLLSFSAENDCEIVVSNTYDVSELQGTFIYGKDEKVSDNGVWGTYEFTSAGNVIASSDIYYTLNNKMVQSLFHTSKRTESMSRIREIMGYVAIMIVVVIVLIILVQLIRKYQLLAFITDRNGLGSLGPKRGPSFSSGSFGSLGRRRRRSSSPYGYLDGGSRRRGRRRRHSRKNDLHF